jgi:hypothetical protein
MADNTFDPAVWLGYDMTKKMDESDLIFFLRNFGNRKLIQQWGKTYIAVCPEQAPYFKSQKSLEVAREVVRSHLYGQAATQKNKVLLDILKDLDADSNKAQAITISFSEATQ